MGQSRHSASVNLPLKRIHSLKENSVAKAPTVRSTCQQNRQIIRSFGHCPSSIAPISFLTSLLTCCLKNGVITSQEKSRYGIYVVVVAILGLAFAVKPANAATSAEISIDGGAVIHADQRIATILGSGQIARKRLPNLRVGKVSSICRAKSSANVWRHTDKKDSTYLERERSSQTHGIQEIGFRRSK